MRSPFLPLALAMACFSAAACHSLSGGHTPRGTATLHDASGRSVGVLDLEQTSTGVRIIGDLSGLPGGRHGIHFHQTGRCDGPDFTSAGAHFNPFNRKHGLENPDGPHAGDMQNVVIPAQGAVLVEMLSPRITLDDANTTVFDGDGTSLVIHAAPDDQRTDPSGNSGARIACGVITRR
jgi:Cu-Zn family superoxide dismutase